MFAKLSAAVMNLRIGTRLMAGFAVLLLACVGVGYAGLRAMSESNQAVENLSGNLLPSLRALANVRAGTLTVQRAERTLLMAARAKDEGTRQQAAAIIPNAWGRQRDGIKAYESLPMSERERAIWGQFTAANADFKRDQDATMAAIAAGDLERAERLCVGSRDVAARVVDRANDLMDIQEELAKQDDAATRASYASARMTLLGTIGAAVLASIVLGLLITRSIVRPLKRTGEVLDGVAKGDLTRRAEVTGRDELGQLAEALNAAIANTQAATDKSLDGVRQLEAVGRAQAVIEFKPDGTVVQANDNFLNCLGYSAAEIAGRHHSMFMDPAEAGTPAYRDFWAKLGRGEYQAGQFRRVGKGGREVWITGGYFPIADAAGRVQKVVKFASDITAAKRLELEAKEAADRQVREGEELRRKVEAIQAGVTALAAGDFTVAIPDLGDDGVGRMAAALNRAVGSVREALEGVRSVAEQLATASGQLAGASEEIATGAQEQASSLEETASTLEEITATVRQNADAAQQARQLASSSKDVAEKGGGVVGAAVGAMGEINQSSKKIADIITAIDEIAFQTNLLALNAAVEAARAGEQGRGFAVVAAEVRNLAQRSATAAKEIKTLIQDSVKKVDAGTELVNRSGQTLDEIVTSVKRVTDIVSEIAAASREQSTGIDQVNKAVSQMDAVTQRNAGQTEEMSATAQALTEQAGQLRDLVGRFKLSDAAPAAAAGPKAAPARKPAAKPAGKPRPAVAKALNGHAANGAGRHELDALGGGDDGFTEF